MNILKEMASEMGEQLTLIFVLNGFRLNKSQLVGCKMKTKVHLFNRDAQEIETICQNYCKFGCSVMVESVLFSLPDFAAISDEHLRLRLTIKAVNYHQSEISSE